MKNLLTLFFAALAAVVYGQTDYDQRLLAKFSEEKIQSMQSTNPQALAFMEYYLEHGFDIAPEVKAKPSSFRGEIKLNSLSRKDINLFELNIPLPLDGPVYYKIKKSDDFLIVHPRKTIMGRFNKENIN